MTVRFLCAYTYLCLHVYHKYDILKIKNALVKRTEQSDTAPLLQFCDLYHGSLHWHNPSSRTVALGLTQPLTEMSTRNISWEQRRPVRRADYLTTFMCRLSWNLGASPSWNPLDLSRPVIGLLYIYLLPRISLNIIVELKTVYGSTRFNWYYRDGVSMRWTKWIQ